MNSGTARIRRSKALASILWVSGAVTSAVLGLVSGLAMAEVGLVVTFLLTLLVARRGLGWRALPLVSVLFALQAPVLFLEQYSVLRVPIGMHIFPLFTDHTQFDRTLFFAPLMAGILASPARLILDLGKRALSGLRIFGKYASPVICAPLLILVGYAIPRKVVRPGPDTFLESLPLVITFPPVDDQVCSGEAHENYQATPDEPCATPLIESGGTVFRATCSAVSEVGRRHCHLRYKDATDKWAGGGWIFPDETITVRRDEADDYLFVEKPRSPAFYEEVHRDRPHYLHFKTWELRSRLSPPLGAALFAVSTWLLWLSSLTGWLWLRRRQGEGDRAMARLWEKRRDLSVIALSLVLCGSAPLIASSLFGLVFG